jgi:hypothetical protein
MSAWHDAKVDLPPWVDGWCRAQLDAHPVAVLHRSTHMSEVLGLRLTDGREVAIKARPSQHDRERACVEVQRHLAAAGYPCAAPLTDVTGLGEVVVHAEEWRPGGEMRRETDAATAVGFATLLAELVTRAAGVEAEPPLPNPEWVRWDHDGPGVWPAIPYHDERGDRPMPDGIEEAARRIRDRLAAASLPRVLGHADWESQNLRWHGDQPWAVHDWDSLAWLPEAAIAGAASGAFGSSAAPTLVPIESSEAFLEAYQRSRRPFTAQELEVAWAASLWLALHNARGEALWDRPPVALAAVREQGAERLRRAGA